MAACTQRRRPDKGGRMMTAVDSWSDTDSSGCSLATTPGLESRAQDDWAAAGATEGRLAVAVLEWAARHAIGLHAKLGDTAACPDSLPRKRQATEAATVELQTTPVPPPPR